MFTLERDKDTICAIATSAGAGAIALIRVSGEHSATVVRKIAVFLPQNLESHKIYYGYLSNPTTLDKIDEVLISYFAQGQSFTGETSFEISCHGSQIIAQQIIEQLLTSGARLAERGEFTYRAFSSGRIDLVQAEGVLSVIESQSALGARVALRQLQGELSNKLHIIEDDLTWCLSRLEANLDFSSEFIEFASADEILQRARQSLQIIRTLLLSYKKGRSLRNGIKISLVGAPNVGKSSLLNCLAQFERAIVSPIEGTTRDVIEIDINIDGQRVIIADTAGLRSTEDQIEALGVAKTIQTISNADLILYVADATRPDTHSLPTELGNVDKPVLCVLNKSDIVIAGGLMSGFLSISALTGQGVENLRKKLSEFLIQGDEDNSVMISNSRHFELLVRAENKLNRAIQMQVDNASPEFIISEMQDALLACFEILGKQFDDQVLDRVFKEFCMGK